MRNVISATLALRNVPSTTLAAKNTLTECVVYSRDRKWFMGQHGMYISPATPIRVNGGGNELWRLADWPLSMYASKLAAATITSASLP
jgi:hypothetical protein